MGAVLLNLRNLRLISEDLNRYLETPTFSSRLNIFMGQIKAAIDRLIEEQGVIPEDVSRNLTIQFALMIKFLSGSSSKRIPYEIAYSLEQALKDWQHNPAIVTTALSPDLMSGFYFQGVSKSFYISLSSFLDVEINERLVQISLPEVYRHCPIFCVPLYHELGHFIDIEFGITAKWLLDYPIDQLPLDDIPLGPDYDLVHRNHRMEYFADLFAASYVGDAVDDFLVQFTGGAVVTTTHPSTVARSSAVRGFLGGAESDLLASLQCVLKDLGLPNLSIRFEEVDLSSSFDNMRPALIATVGQLHGLFLHSWKYLAKQSEEPSGWATSISPNECERVINNLVEKSIRNYMIKEKWET